MIWAFRRMVLLHWLRQPIISLATGFFTSIACLDKEKKPVTLLV